MLPISTDGIGYYFPVPRLGYAGDYGAVLNARVTGQDCFDFPKLYAISSDLDLPVGAARELNESIGTVPRKIAGPAVVRQILEMAW